MDILEHNRKAWDKEVENGNIWTLPVGPEVITEARAGRWSVLLTPTIPVPREWFGEVQGKEILLLASGGGQQGPILAAAGARVTVFDNSPRQLESDRMVAEREGLELATLQGDMRDLSRFPVASFDLIFHPVSNCFVDDILSVWRGAARVLRPGGALLAGFCNPMMYVFNHELAEQGIYQLHYPLPYSDLADMTQAERDARWGVDAPLEWSHTLSEQIGGQLAAGLLLAGFYEDVDPNDKMARFFPQFFATRALKP